MGQPMRNDRRRHVRFTAKAKVVLRWQESNGFIRSSTGVAEDVSKSGMRLTMDKSVPAQGIVNVECRDLKLAGVAQIRHSRKDGYTYSVAVEFLGGLEWKSKAPEAVN